MSVLRGARRRGAPSSPITIVNPIPLLWLFWELFLYAPGWFVILESLRAQGAARQARTW
jgi:hypothetical protein